MTSWNIDKIFSKLVYAGIDADEQSLAEVKSITMLTRMILLSFFILVFYTILMFELGYYANSLFCFISLPIITFIYYLITRKKIAQAKISYTGLILFLYTFFAIYFGKGIGSEYWIIIMGGVSLLIYRRKDNAFAFVAVSLIVFFIIELFQWYFPPVAILDESIRETIITSNIVFIFLTAYMVSYILRFSSEDFEKRIEERNKELIHKNKDLIDSINYSKRIQKAVLPSDQQRQILRKNIFVMFEPKDIVSGDFYWIHRLNDRLLFGIVDGSGFGVSGALISIMAHTLLSQCVEEYGLRSPLDIMEKLKSLIYERKEKWQDHLAENLEFTLCAYDWKTFELSYATNGNVLYLIKHVNNIEEKDEMKIIDDDRYAMKEIRKAYHLIKEPVQKGAIISGVFNFRKDDMLYLATNGFSSQIGGPKGKKLKANRLRDLLMSVQHFTLKKQQFIINDVLVNWKGKLKPTDDITLMGFKI